MKYIEVSLNLVLPVYLTVFQAKTKTLVQGITKYLLNPLQTVMLTENIGLLKRWAVTQERVSITGIPPVFWVSIPVTISYCDLKSLDSSLNIKTQVLRALIPVSISRIKFQNYWFQSQYQDSYIKSFFFHSWCPDLTFEFRTFVQTLTLALQIKNY